MKRKLVILFMAAAMTLSGCQAAEPDEETEEAEVSEEEESEEEESEEEEEPQEEDSEDTKEEEEEDADEEQEDEKVSIDVDEQLDIIVDSYDTYKVSSEDEAALNTVVDYCYAVTDLDSDGLLEIIKVCYGEEKKSTYTQIYEVASDKTLKAWDMTAFRELDVEPNLASGLYLQKFKNDNLLKKGDNCYLVAATKYDDDGYGRNIYYKMTFEKDAIVLNECVGDDASDAYENGTRELISEIKDVNKLSVKHSYEKKFVASAEDVTGKYTEFLNNEISATFDYEGDTAWLEYENGQSVTFEELLEVMRDDYEDDIEYGYLTRYSYIDCGIDGEYELLMTLHNYSPNVNYDMVLKYYNGNLYIRYILPEGERDEVWITDKGYVHDFGKGGASLAILRYGYLDEEVRYNFYYSLWYYLSVDSAFPDALAKVDTSTGWENIQVLIYYLDEYQETALYEVYDYEKETDAPDEMYREPFEKSGIELLTEKEIDERLLEWADTIGLDREIIEE